MGDHTRLSVTNPCRDIQTIKVQFGVLSHENGGGETDFRIRHDIDCVVKQRGTDLKIKAYLSESWA